MVVLLVGIPGVEAGALPGTSDKLEFVSVNSLAEALTFLELRSCDAVLIGSEAADVRMERINALIQRTPAVADVGLGAAVARTSHGRGDVLEHTFRSGSIRDMERLMILDRLARLNQNRTRSAESLEISVRTLRNKLRDYRSEGVIAVTSESKSG